ncbi:uncharacterized protein LOC144168041 [Haemaphysalis longicornis]
MAGRQCPDSRDGPEALLCAEQTEGWLNPGSEAELPPWPAVVSPFFFVPATNFQQLYPFSPFAAHEQGDFVQPLYIQDHLVAPSEGPAACDIEHALQPFDYGGFLHALHVRDMFHPTEAGEPHGEPPMSSEGCGDAQVAFFERNVWESLQETYYGPLVTNYGTVSVILKQRMRVDITVDRAIRLVNFEKRCTAAINCFGDMCCLCHPCGRVYQERMSVDMATGTRLAKISSRGVTFTALNHGLVYLVDASGTKSTTERFHNLGYDIPLSVFYSQMQRSSPDVFEKCLDLIGPATVRTSRNGDHIWNIGGVRIKQTPWGDVQVSRDSGRRMICSSPTAGSISITTPVVKMAVTCDPSRYFFVRMGKKRIIGSADGFAVKNGSQRAGFDRRGRVTLP